MGRDEAADRFIARWADRPVTERSQCHSFIAQLCALIGVDAPDDAVAGDPDYAFERKVRFIHDDGSSTEGRIDCYRRGCFVLEAKQSDKRKPGGEMAPPDTPARTRTGRPDNRLDEVMARALRQARGYAHALDEWPPFLVLVDVGRCIELWADFSGLGKAYSPFPSRADYRIGLDDLRYSEVRQRLNKVWTNPRSLDPATRRTAVTTEIASDLSKLIVSLEGARRTAHAGADGTRSRHVALYILQCTFAMFAQDVGALPARAFDQYLELYRHKADRFHHAAERLFGLMCFGGFCDTIQADIRRFNGGLFRERPIVRLTEADLALLTRIARHDWREVEPAIFGSLLEQALSPDERGRLGAHFTPRAYVERLILPTIIEPLRADWDAVLGSALKQARDGKLEEARRAVIAFHRRLCETRVLDPACGTGNFLYVAMGAMQDLEEEVLSRLASLGHVQQTLGLEGLTISPEQFWGLEINPMSAWIAEMMLWVGYLQRQFLRHGRISATDPVLKAFGTIQCRDALVSRTREAVDIDAAGAVAGRWTTGAMVRHPVTGEQVPDSARRDPTRRIIDPRPAEWPDAHFIVGNPPFISGNSVRATLGDGYLDALRATHGVVLRGADLAMYWWDRAAQTLSQPGSSLRRFGFITSNSITQALSRKVVQGRLGQLSLVYAIADHPWRAGPGQASVRIAMTVAEAGGARSGRLATVRADGELGVERHGVIGAQLTLATTTPQRLKANRDLAFRGVSIGGAGFWTPPEATARFRADPASAPLLRRIVNGRDLTGASRDAWVIDTYGLSEAELRITAPDIYQWLLLRVKPHRDVNARAAYRDAWWTFAEPRPEMRAATADLTRQIVTPMTAKHRVFQFLSIDRVVDQGLICIARDDSYALGLLSSRAHLAWAAAQGGTLEDRPRYNNSLCFETFPWPRLAATQRGAIAELAEELDASRKSALKANPGLTMTGLYNLRAKSTAGATLSPTERAMFEAARVAVISRLHDHLDAQVAEAYGWPGGLADDAMVEALRRLNIERAAEERAGRVWRVGDAPAASLSLGLEAPALGPPPLPTESRALASALLRALQQAGRPLPTAGLTSRFRDADGRRERRRIEDALGGLSVAGVANHTPDGRWFVPSRAA